MQRPGDRSRKKTKAEIKKRDMRYFYIAMIILLVFMILLGERR